MMIYLFHIHNKELNDEYIGVPKENIISHETFDTALYAHTNNKKFADIFKRERDMNKFYLKKIKMSEKEYEEFSERNCNTILKPHLYQTSMYDDGILKTTHVFINSTEMEYDKILFEYNYYIAKEYDNIIEVLNDLDYEDFNQDISEILSQTFAFYNIIDWMKFIDEGLSYPYSLNSVMLYNHLFKNTFKERSVLNCIFGDFSRNLKLIEMNYLKE